MHITGGDMQVLCHHCGSGEYMKNATYKGVQRYKCNLCKRSFTSRGELFSKAIKDKELLMYL